MAVTRERRLLEQIIKSWAQDHTEAFTIADFSNTDEAMDNTSGYLTWVVREGHCNLDLTALADRIELFMQNRRKRSFADGMRCQKCKTFYEYAEPNQEDGSMICYSCRSNPFT